MRVLDIDGCNYGICRGDRLAADGRAGRQAKISGGQIPEILSNIVGEQASADAVCSHRAGVDAIGADLSASDERSPIPLSVACKRRGKADAHAVDVYRPHAGRCLERDTRYSIQRHVGVDHAKLERLDLVRANGVERLVERRHELVEPRDGRTSRRIVVSPLVAAALELLRHRLEDVSQIIG